MLLRHQLAILQRTQPRPARLTRWERLVLALLTARLARLWWWRPVPAERLPPPVPAGYRACAGIATWCGASGPSPSATGRGRPRTDPDLRGDGPAPGAGEPRVGLQPDPRRTPKLGRAPRPLDGPRHSQAASGPASARAFAHGHYWRQFLARHRHQVLACDFLVVESLRLKTLYVPFFIELGTRRVHLAGCTAHPTGAWVAQQARNLAWRIQDGEVPCRFLIHDRDAKFTAAFDRVFAQEGVEVVRTPPRCPQANAVAERWVRSARHECLDHLLILGERQLHRTLMTYCRFYNERRPHQGLGQRCPIPLAPAAGSGAVIRHDALGGLLHDYSREAA